jgi:hypothetical protein
MRVASLGNRIGLFSGGYCARFAAAPFLEVVSTKSGHRQFELRPMRD